jgi:hypothetical protein
MVRQGFTRKCWSEFLCLGDYLAPPRQVGGVGPRDALDPPADPRRWRTAGGPVAGAQMGILAGNLRGISDPTWLTTTFAVVSDNSK